MQKNRFSLTKKKYIFKYAYDNLFLRFLNLHFQLDDECAENNCVENNRA